MNHRLSNLDLLRGLAALAVCAGHLRAFLFVDFGQVASAGIIDRAFYLATGLGHQAVMVFFVLSGYLVGGSVLTAYEQGRWSWRDYALRRMTRLWVVLLPALVLTLVFDRIGLAWAPAGYDGAFTPIHSSGPTAEAPADWRATTFLGNAFFLQTIRVNAFGTNGPLWSLANEFWYYLLFPLIWGIVATRQLPDTSMPARALSLAVSAVLLVALLLWLPSGLLWSGLIWLFGVGAFWLGRFEKVRTLCRHPLWLVGAGVLALASLAASKTTSAFGSDWSIGLMFALWVPGLASTPRGIPGLRKLGEGLSEMSYTLYVIHFPLLALVFYGYFRGTQYQPALTGYAWYAALLAATLAVSIAVWWCFERNTASVRKRIEAAFARPAARASID